MPWLNTILLLDADGASTLSAAADIAQVFIALINLFFAGYVILYQIRKDDRDTQARRISEQETTRLQWFKELIVLPNTAYLSQFFEQVRQTTSQLRQQGLSDVQKGGIIDQLKLPFKELTHKLVDPVHSINPALHQLLKTTLDNLLDGITNHAFASDLADQTLYNTHVADQIIITQNTIVSSIINYRGN